MKGDKWQCPKCKHIIKEADLPYTEALCRRTTGCRTKGATSMVKVVRDGDR